MLVLATFRYLCPLDEALAHLDDHRAHLRGLHAAGELVLSGPLEPRTGGVLLLCMDSLETAHARTAADPFVLRGLAEYQLVEWRPVIGADLAAKWEAHRIG